LTALSVGQQFEIIRPKGDVKGVFREKKGYLLTMRKMLVDEQPAFRATVIAVADLVLSLKGQKIPLLS